MSRTVVFANQKGGVGKTTTCVNLAVYLARMGKQVLLVDADPQGNASSGLGVPMADRVDRSLYELLIGKKQLAAVLLPTHLEGLTLLGSTFDLSGAQMDLLQLPDKEFLLQGLLAPAAHSFDFIFIDTPPSLGILTLNALTAADGIIIPVQSEFYAMEGIAQLLKAVKMVKSQLNAALSIEGVVITMYDHRTKLAREVLNEVRKYFDAKLFRSLIPRNVRLSEAPSFGESIFEYDERSPGAQAYRRLGEEFLLRQESMNPHIHP